MTKTSKIYIALPCLNELKNLPVFIADLKQQSFKNYILYACVNQPDEWWNVSNKKSICENNLASIAYLRCINDMDIRIIDFCSKGKGWKGKQLGVGWARKILMDNVNEIADKDDIVISIDADTRFNPNYLESVYNSIHSHPKALAISVPYYHRLIDKEAENRAILRYEIYMRYYAINLWRIKSPYSFTALGSAIAFPVWAYRKIGGISPMKSGEDFYFLQKFCKTGSILHWNTEKVYPEARFSDRVFFGTGPAMIKGDKGDWNSYPVYHYSLFDNLKETSDRFPALYAEDIDLSIADFLKTQFNDDKWWVQIRKNFKTEAHFVKACHEKLDGLRCLQYLKTMQPSLNKTDENSLYEFLSAFYPDALSLLQLKDDFNFTQLSVEQMDNIRNYLLKIEESYQQQHYFKSTNK